MGRAWRGVYGMCMVCELGLAFDRDARESLGLLAETCEKKGRRDERYRRERRDIGESGVGEP